MALILAAAQIRFQLETLTAAETRNKEAEDQGFANSCPPPLFFVAPVESLTFKVSNLANELSSREVSDWKERYEKASHTLRIKDQQLKTVVEETAKLQQLSNDLRRDLEKSKADSKSNERFLKCVQAEYELLRSISGKSNDAVGEMKEEASRLTKTTEELTRIVNFQGHEVKVKIEENEKRCKEKKVLELSVISHLEAATTASGKAAKAALLLDSIEEKNQRLEQRLASASDQLQQERSLNKSYRAAASESEAAATSASVALVDAATLHAELIERLSDRDREIALLKLALENAGHADEAGEAGLSAQGGGMWSAVNDRDQAATGLPSKRARCDSGSTTATATATEAHVIVTSGFRESLRRESDGSATASECRSVPVPVPVPVQQVPVPVPAPEQSAAEQSRRTTHVAPASTNNDNGACPICLEPPYGLMQSCAKCKVCMHSSCVRRHLSRTEHGGLLLCPICKPEA